MSTVSERSSGEAEKKNEDFLLSLTKVSHGSLRFLPFGLSVMQLQKLPLHFTFCWVVSSQGDVCCNEVQVDRTRLQPDRASQQRGLTETQRLTGTLNLPGRLQPGRLAVLLLFDVLTDVYILHHSADALSHRLVVQVAVGYANDRRLGRVGEKKQKTGECMNSRGVKWLKKQFIQ